MYEIFRLLTRDFSAASFRYSQIGAQLHIPRIEVQGNLSESNHTVTWSLYLGMSYSLEHLLAQYAITMAPIVNGKQNIPVFHIVCFKQTFKLLLSGISKFCVGRIPYDVGEMLFVLREITSPSDLGTGCSFV